MSQSDLETKCLKSQYHIIMLDHSKQKNQLQDQNISQGNAQTINTPINYQLTNCEIIRQSECCRAIIFNQESNLMVAASDTQIKIFEFKQGQLNLLQLLNEHTMCINTLFFMKKSCQFISGSHDKQMRIWSINDNKQWFCKQFLKDCHSSAVICIIMNIAEDLIISCSNDIKFWIKQKEWQYQQTLVGHTGHVLCISLNESQNQLVSGGSDKQILIYQFGQNKKFQRIQTNSVVIRLCFIGDNIITCQPYREEAMLIFQFKQQTKQFIKSNEVKIKAFSNCNCFFPQIFNQQKQILLNKNGETVYLMRKQSQTEFIIHQALKFGTQHVFGTLTDDGEYLVTWDYISTTFQVRKYCLQNNINEKEIEYV